MWENVRCLPTGETVTVGGVHLGHNLPDAQGLNRYCVNLSCVSGYARSAVVSATQTDSSQLNSAHTETVTVGES